LLRPFSLVAVADGQDGLEQGQPPGQLARDAGLVVLPGVIRPREGRAWLVDWQGTRAVLRQQTLTPSSTSVARLIDDVAWLHGFLAELASLGFPSPRPLPSFDGQSWSVADGALWEMVSFLPGQVVGWADKPPMEEIGGLLARYHATTRQIKVPSQRPGALRLAEVPKILLSPQLEAAGVPPDRASSIRQVARQLARDLRDTAALASERIVIHGDFTNHNVLAAGTPPRATGVIDFALAHAESPLADIGYGLWRSGRPYQDADHLDLSRAQNFVRGYASTVRLSPGQAQMIPLYLRGRGLQMIAKRIRAGRAETGMLAQVQWLTANSGLIGDALAAVVP
jgi:Ser/Thr protein kinase RdoA (MazF antagonist)